MKALTSGEVIRMPSSVVVAKLELAPSVRPPFDRTINADMVEARKVGAKGAVVAWTDHGRIAVVKHEDGTQGAYRSSELSVAPN